MDKEIKKEGNDFKVEQKERLKEMVRADEESGLYDSPKYYSPEVNEFRIGFKYERFLVKELTLPIKKEYEDTWAPMRWTGGYPDRNSLAALIRHGHIRVKHLDREDIESFGFVWNENWISFYRNPDFELQLESKDGINYVSIATGFWDECDVFCCDVVFRGTIKNKSELEVILKQIGVIK